MRPAGPLGLEETHLAKDEFVNKPKDAYKYNPDGGRQIGYDGLRPEGPTTYGTRLGRIYFPLREFSRREDKGPEDNLTKKSRNQEM